MSVQSAHKHLVKTLYRQVIKLQLNWVVYHEDWRRQALQTRQMFESNATLKDPQEIARKIKETQKWIKEHWHPDPYNIPTQQNGSSFQRNVAPPVEILSPYHGLPEAGDSKGHH